MSKTVLSRTLLLLGACVALVLPAQSGNADPNTQLLPDLREAPVGCVGGYGGNPMKCDDWDVCMVRDANDPNGDCVKSGAIAAVRIRFTTAVDNAGAGPLVVLGERPPGQSTMTVRQAFQEGVGGAIPQTYANAQRATAMSMYYEPEKMHEHWHLLGFEHFQLMTLNGGVVVTDRKNGFCLGDRYKTADAGKLPNTPHGEDDSDYSDAPQNTLAKFLQGTNCDHLQPQATDVTEGISVGRGDDYTYDVDFQWLDLTSAPSGTYDIVNTVNADHTILESDYTNDSSSIAIAIQWPDGASKAPAVITQAPTVTLLRSCPGSAVCLP
ncbi:MAG TPA: lysyl oxidase family protein [Pseudonocardiaceae bacterium]|nr:lysyl oxidase family protein [Pseudonocardiaceae bacterium]